MAVNILTVKRWALEVDRSGEWHRFDEDKGLITRIYCEWCHTHSERLKSCRNYSPAFVEGISGKSLKKDNVAKHSKSQMHEEARRQEKRPTASISKLYTSTPIGRAMAVASSEEEKRVQKLFDVAYYLAKEELPFAKFPSLLALEKRHGVALGNTYATDKKCREFTDVISQTLKDAVLKDVKASPYISLLMDGSTDSSVKEKELIYVMFARQDGTTDCRFLRLKDFTDATAEGIFATVQEVFAKMGIDDWKTKLIGLCVDGAAVNLGRQRGLVALLRQEVPWIVGIHCLNHRLELAVKDAFSDTYMTEVAKVLMDMYYVYQKSPKRLRQLRDLGSILETAVKKPEKAHGTRWLQHKCNALGSLMAGYAVICAHIESLSSESSPATERSRFQGYLKKLKSFKFVLHMLFFRALLKPLAKLSCNLQGSLMDLPLAIAILDTLYVSAERLRKGTLETTEISKFLSAVDVENGRANYCGVKLTGVRRDVLEAFNNSRNLYITAVNNCIANRMNDLKKDFFKAVRLLDTKLWPTDKDQIISYGDSEISSAVCHFNLALEAKNASVENIMSEWTTFKVFWLDNLQHVEKNKIWPFVLTEYNHSFSNLVHLIRILLLLPVSNAIVERGFSAMRRIKTDWRSSLGEDSLDNLMRNSIDGPSTQNFESKEATRRFFTTARRSGTQPYGSRKRTYEDSHSESV